MFCFLCGWEFKNYLIWYDRTHTSTGDSFEVLKCIQCGLEKTMVNKDSISKYYPAQYYSYNPWINWMEKLLRRSFSLLQKWKFDILRGILWWKLIKYPYKTWWWRFLDIWCGNSSHFSFLEKYKWRCSGFEIGEWWRRDNIFYGANIYSYPEDIKYDWITLWHVLEHFDDPVWYMKAISSLMKNDWKLVVSVPNQDSWYSKLFGSYRYNRDIPRHLYNRSPKTLNLLADKVWLRIDNVYHQSLFSWANSILLLLKNKISCSDSLINLLRPLLYIIFLPFDLISNFFKRGDVITVVYSKF